MFFCSRKFKCYLIESFVDFFCFHSNPIWKTNLKKIKNEASWINEWSDLLVVQQILRKYMSYHVNCL